MASNTVVNTNVLSLNAYRNLTTVGNKQSKASSRLSSGKKINSAADDAAGLAITEKMTAQIRGLNMAYKNSQDAVSLVQTAEGSIAEIDNMVQRIRELAVQSATDTNEDDDRAKIEKEVSDLKAEIDEMAKRTQFNKKDLNVAGNKGDVKGKLEFQIGANQSQVIKLDLQKFDTGALGLSSTAVSSRSNAQKAIKECDDAIKSVATYRAELGALQNRLEYTASNLQVSSENLSAARMRIQDADMATEMMNLTSANVLQQAATAMLAQANQAPQSILQLLG